MQIHRIIYIYKIHKYAFKEWIYVYPDNLFFTENKFTNIIYIQYQKKKENQKLYPLHK